MKRQRIIIPHFIFDDYSGVGQVRNLRSPASTGEILLPDRVKPFARPSPPLPSAPATCYTATMQDRPNRNDDHYVREGGPYAEMIRELVESGRFDSAAEVVLEGLALVRERELLRKAHDVWLRGEIQKGIDSADRGELIPADEVFARLQAKYSQRAKDDLAS